MVSDKTETYMADGRYKAVLEAVLDDRLSVVGLDQFERLSDDVVYRLELRSIHTYADYYRSTDAKYEVADVDEVLDARLAVDMLQFAMSEADGDEFGEPVNSVEIPAYSGSSPLYLDRDRGDSNEQD